MLNITSANVACVFHISHDFTSAKVKSVFPTYESLFYRPASKTGSRYNDHVTCFWSPSWSV